MSITPRGPKRMTYDSSGTDSDSGHDSSDDEAISDLISNGAAGSDKSNKWNNTTALGSLSYSISTSPKKSPQKVPIKKKPDDALDALGDKLGGLRLNKPDLEPPKNAFFSKLQEAQSRHEKSRTAAPNKDGQPEPKNKDSAAQPGPKIKDAASAAGLRHSKDHYKLAKSKQKPTEKPNFHTPEKSFRNTPTKKYEDTKTFNTPAQRYNTFKSSFLTPMSPSSKHWGHRITPAELYEPVPVSSPAPQRSVPQNARWGTKNDFSAFASGNNLPDVVSFSGGVDIAAGDPKKAILDLLESLKSDEDANEDGSNEIDGLLVPLLPHQVKGIKFLKKRESRKLENKGGFLFDDMGLGKTVQSISLILSNQKKKKSNKVKKEDTKVKKEDTTVKKGEEEKKTAKKEKKEKEKEKEEDDPNEIKATLVVCPVALTTQWADEIRSKAPGLRVYIHHGQQRYKSSEKFHEYDVIVTTFSVMASEGRALTELLAKEKSKLGPPGPLFDKKWWRIILDEAHTIKNQDSKTARAAYLLKSDRRWCLTGTPVQNSIDDLYSLVRFIRVKPYCDFATWNSKIGEPLKKRTVAGSGLKVLHVFLSAVMLRRTKAVLGSSGVILPARRRQIVSVDLNEEHRRAYKEIEVLARDRADWMVEHKVSTSFIASLTILLRLRQACDHSKLAFDGLDDKKGAFEKRIREPERNPSTEDDDLARLLGGLTVEDEEDEGYGDDEIVKPSPKMEALMKLLKEEPDRKTIVFSQFTKMMDLVGPHFTKNGIKYVRYDGSMKRDQRDAALNQLREDKSTKVLLCSLKCGALGLNLTVASRVIIVDPWWNPMIIEQAIDRVHRLGQTVPVDVYELVVKNSVEEKMMALQDKKRALAQGVLSGEDQLINKLTSEELTSLLQ